MAKYNTDLQQNNTELDEILQTVNNLPEAGGPPPVIQPIKITKNGTTTAPSGVDGYSPIEVAVPTPAPVIQSKTITANGTYTAPSGVDGFSPVTVNCPVPKAEQEKTVPITANGDIEILPDVGKVLSKVLAQVNVPTGGGGGDVSPFDHIEVKTWTPAGFESEYNIENPTNLEAFAMFRLAGNVEYGFTAAAIRCSANGGYMTPNKNFGGASYEFKKQEHPYYYGEAAVGSMPNNKNYYSFESSYYPEFGDRYAVILCYGPLKS